MTVLEIIQRSAEFLEKKGVESPRLQSELLLAQVLGLPRMKLYLSFDRTLTNIEIEKMRDLVRRRGTREPLQHILGSTSFCGFEMAVSPDVLIPRPETELLAERAWNFLLHRPQPKALDFGTGSGCIAIAIASKCPGAQVHAVDISPEALAVAEKNALRNQVRERVHFHLSNGFESLPQELRFDLIVSNPPYIPSAEIATLEPEVRQFDPLRALDGGASGLEFYQRLAHESKDRLLPGGKIMLEFGEGQAESIRDLFQDHNWHVNAVERDYTGRDRFLIAGLN